MKKYSQYILIAFAAMVMCSCRKYVEIDDATERTLKYTSDFQALLSDITTMETSYQLPLISADDYDVAANTIFDTRIINDAANVYTWAAEYYTVNQTDAGWNQLYKVIYTCNEIIAHVNGSLNGTAAQKAKIYAEAQAQRAYCYLHLANMYAPVYNKSTANSVLGVPMTLTPDLFTDLTRVPLQTVYDQVITDVTAALPALDKIPNNPLHPGQAAGNAILARTYLYMQDYAKAAEYAAKALAIQDSVVDLTKLASRTAIPRRLLNPEVILSKSTIRPGNYTLPLSKELLGYFVPQDLRYVMYTDTGRLFSPAFTGRGSYRAMTPQYEYISTGPTVPEMMLIQAEGLARNSQTDAAMALVNKLRLKRFKTADYTALTASSATEAIKQVLAERRRELFDMGLRWFDQRRLSTEAAWAETETRVFKGTTYTLAPGSNRYVYPIPPNVIQLNPEVQQNAR